jgi:hypothetical protein
VSSVIVLCVVFATLALLLAFSRWLARRPWAAAGNLLVALLLLVFAYSFWPAAVNLRSYDAVPRVGPVAQIYAERLAPHAYRVTLTRLPAGRMQVFDVVGDEWRLDARTLTWRNRATQLGLAPTYRLDRLSGRYLRRDDSGIAPALPSSFGLADADEVGDDIWAQARTGTHWERVANAQRAYGPWQPLVDGGRFDVWMLRQERPATLTLDARPANAAAAKALQARNRVAATLRP